MNKKAKIIYRGFYDLPLAFVVSHNGRQLLFWRDFDDDLDEYPETYQVYLLPCLSDEELTGSWERLPERAINFLGEVPVGDVQFDSTRRREIDTAVLDALLPAREVVAA